MRGPRTSPPSCRTAGPPSGSRRASCSSPSRAGRRSVTSRRSSPARTRPAPGHSAGPGDRHRSLSGARPRHRRGARRAGRDHGHPAHPAAGTGFWSSGPSRGGDRRAPAHLRRGRRLPHGSRPAGRDPGPPGGHAPPDHRQGRGGGRCAPWGRATRTSCPRRGQALSGCAIRRAVSGAGPGPPVPPPTPPRPPRTPRPPHRGRTTAVPPRPGPTADAGRRPCRAGSGPPPGLPAHRRRR